MPAFLLKNTKEKVLFLWCAQHSNTILQLNLCLLDNVPLIGAEEPDEEDTGWHSQADVSPSHNGISKQVTGP